MPRCLTNCSRTYALMGMDAEMGAHFDNAKCPSAHDHLKKCPPARAHLEPTPARPMPIGHGLGMGSPLKQGPIPNSAKKHKISDFGESLFASFEACPD